MIKKLFFILFCIASIIYGYGNIANYELLKTVCIFSLAPLLLAHYLLNTKKVTPFYILALIFTFLGDTSFHIHSTGIAREALTLGSYIFLNLLIAIIIFERIEFKGLKRTLFTAIALGLILLLANYIVFKDAKHIILSTGIYFISLAILCATSISFYLRTKSRESIFFLIGVLSFVIASIAKGLEYTSNSPLSIILNILFYAIGNYYYCNAMLLIDKQKAETP